MFSVPLCASSLSFYISLYLQCPIMCKFSIFLPFHYIFSVPFWASSLSIYIPLDLQCPILGKYPIILCISLYIQCPIMCKFPIFLPFIISFSVPLCASSPIFLHSIISLVSHSGQVPYSFTFHYFFSVPLCAVLHIFTFHYIFSVPLCASSLTFYVSLYLQCPILGKFPIFLPFIISSVSHYVQVLHIFTFHSIFSVPFCASSLTSYVSLYFMSHSGQVLFVLQCPILGPLFTFHELQCPILGKFSYLFTFHYIFSVPLWASSLSINPLSSVSHYVQVLHLFTFHYIFSVPFWASSLSIYIPVDIQCPILGKFPIYLHSIRSSVSHYVHVPYLFTFHFIFSVPLCASSLTSYISLYLQCPILGKYPIVLRFIISSVSHYVQVLHIFTFHSIFSVPLCASSLTSYVSLYLQCPILGKYPIILCFIIYLVSHYVQVLYLFTFHQIFSVPSCASSPFFSIYISLYLQCPILGKFPIYLHFIISLVSHFGQVPYLFTFHQIFSVPLCASSPYFYISFYIQCPILCKFPNFLCFVISSVSHSGQVPNNFVLHYIFSVPLCASSLSFYLSLYLQFPILMCQFPPFDMFHYIFSVPFWASTLQFYVSLYLQCPIMSKYPLILCFIIYLVSHYVQVLHLFTFHYIFSVPFWASTLQLYVSLFLQYPIMCMFPIFLRFIISSVSHYVPVLHIFTFHYIFGVPLCASSLTSYVSLYIQCPIMCKFPIFLPFIISLVSHSYVLVPSI